MNWAPNRLVVSLVLGLASVPASARPDLALRGLILPGEAKLHNQLHRVFCGAFHCLTTRDEPEVVQKAPTFSAHVEAARKQKRLHLRFRAAPGVVESVWDLPIRRSRVDSKVLREVLARALLQVVASIPPPASPPEPAPSSTIPPEASARPVATPAAAASPAIAPFADTETPPPHMPWVQLEAGAGALNRDLTFSGLTSGSVRDFQGRALLLAVARGRISPFGGVSSTVLQGLSLRGEFERTLGAFAAVDAGLKYPLTYQRIDAGLSWRFPLGDHVRLGPEGGYRLASFTVGAASDGSIIPYLPNTAYNGAWAGLEFGLLVGRFALELHGLYLPSVQMGTLFTAFYFPNGKATGLSADVSLHLRIVGPLVLAIGGSFTRYAATLNPASGNPIVAKAATDQLVGARATLGVDL